MANTLLTPIIIAKEFMFHLENELVIANTVNVDYSSEFTGDVGDTINVRRPNMTDVIENNLDLTGVSKDALDSNVPVTMDKTLTSLVEFTPTELTLDIANSRIQQIVRDAAIRHKDKIEFNLGMDAAKYFFNSSGTPGSAVNSFMDVATANAQMTEVAVPSERCAMHPPLTAAGLADAQRLNQAPRSKAATAIEKVMVGTFGGMDNYESVHIPPNTNGAQGGSPTVAGAGQSSTYTAAGEPYQQTLDTAGWSNSVTGVLKAGDVFTIAGVFSVNPVSRETTGRLQRFVVIADADSSGSGTATLTISPRIIPVGQADSIAYPTVTAAPADGAAITVVSGAGGAVTSQSVCYHRDALLMVTRPLSIANGAGVRTATTTGNRTSISVTEQTDFNTLKHRFRVDTLFGTRALRPDLGHRIFGATLGA